MKAIENVTKRFPLLICWLLGGVFIFLVVFVHVSLLVFTVHELLDAQVRTHLDPEMFLSRFFIIDVLDLKLETCLSERLEYGKPPVKKQWLPLLKHQ